MNNLIAQIEKLKPFFEKISRNKFLRAVKDGFIATIPVILFSSIFMLIAYVPNIFGFYWGESVEAFILKPYNYSMGILGLLVAGTTAKSLTDSFNRDLPTNNQLSGVSTMVGSIVAFLLLSADSIEGGFASEYLGTTGLLSAFVSAFITVIVYNFFVKRNITIKLPEEVPPNIAQTFKDLIPFSVNVLIIYGIDLIVRSLTGTNFATAIIELFQPLFSAADGYIGLALIAGAISLFWFVGIHGPSIVEPAISAVIYVNLEANLELFSAGEQAINVLTPGLQYFVITLGGTGATFVVPYMFMLLGKSKQNKAIGKASFIPTSFGVNEPILFGAPIVLNPVFFVPFILAPIANVWIFKFFVDALGMNSFMYFLPWTTPGPIGLVLGTGLAGLAFLLAVLLLVVDFIIYYPFFKVYDRQRVEKENAEIQDQENITQKEDKQVSTSLKNESEYKEDESAQGDPKTASDDLSEDMNETNVLVLCAGGGTSAQLANSLEKGAKELNVPIEAAGGTYGGHYDIMKNYDLIILGPQVASNYEDIKKDADKLGVELVKTKGSDYISLTRDPKGAIEFVNDALRKNKQ